jgi:hypothetical protein
MHSKSNQQSKKTNPNRDSDAMPLAECISLDYQISIRKITFWLTIITLVLNFLGVIGRGIEFLLGIEETSEIVRLVHVAEEGNLTTWFSAMLLLISSILLGLITSANHKQRKTYVKHWAVLAVIFFLMSLDEAARIHELTIEPLRSLFDASGIFYYAWVLLALPFLIILAFTYWKFVRDLPKRSRLLFILSGLVYVTAAMGMDMIVGYFISSDSAPRLLEPLLITVEELGENVAIVMFIFALLSHLKHDLKVSQLEFQVS